MTKRILTTLMGIIICVCVSTLVYSGLDENTIDNSAFDNPKRSPSLFNHDYHMEDLEIEECSACHHVYEDRELVVDESSEGESCEECHPVEPEDKTTPLMKAFHLNCKGCHKERKSGPVMCGQCHLK
ncbi:acidic tetraheme cytochrome c3 TmcA [Thermodesulfobacteriota bacterium]